MCCGAHRGKGPGVVWTQAELIGPFETLGAEKRLSVLVLQGWIVEVSGLITDDINLQVSDPSCKPN